MNEPRPIRSRTRAVEPCARSESRARDKPSIRRRRVGPPDRSLGLRVPFRIDTFSLTTHGYYYEEVRESLLICAKLQSMNQRDTAATTAGQTLTLAELLDDEVLAGAQLIACLLYTSDAADEL